MRCKSTPLVAIPGDYAPPTTPVASARRRRRLTALLIRAGLVTFAAVSVLLYPGSPTKVSDERDIHQDRAQPAQGPPPGSLLLMGVGR
jgi:hypothetical protein